MSFFLRGALRQNLLKINDGRQQLVHVLETPIKKNLKGFSMIKSINAEELKAKLDAGEELILVDCREQEEWDEDHIPNAIFMPLSTFQENFNKLDSNKQIIMQCRSGKRSLTACQILQENDYEDLTNLEGGILGWKELGYEVTKD
jgi:rhodanese-related sulfurtransferase